MDESNEATIAMPVDAPVEVPAVPAVVEVPVVERAKGISRQRVEAIASATLGYHRYLVRAQGGLRWSEYSEHDDNPHHEDWEPGCAIFAAPLEALRNVLEACDFLVDPDTNELLVMVIR